MSTGQRRPVTRMPAVNTRAARNWGLEDRPATVTDHLLERAPEAWRAYTLVVALLALVVAAAKQLATDEVTLVPACLVCKPVCVDRGCLLLALALEGQLVLDSFLVLGQRNGLACFLVRDVVLEGNQSLLQ